MTRLSHSLDRLNPRYDVIVVGSGYGGGVAASRLARMGKRVCVLERGREHLTGEFPSRFPDLKGAMQLHTAKGRTGPETALYDVRIGADMHVLVGCGLGGGSLVNAGVALRPDPRVFADEVWPGEIRQDGTLDEGYARAERWIAPQSDPRADEMTKFQALQSAGRGAGHETIAPRVAVSFSERVNAAGIRQPACTRCGDCCGGCNVGAKNTVALSYLPDAVRHGAELFTCAKVSHLEKSADGRWRVVVRRLDANDAGEVRVEADMVVLGAGTLGSTEILLRSAARGLTLSDQLGKRFSANGDIIAFGWGAKPAINAIGIGHPPKLEGVEIGAAVSGQIEIRDGHNLSHELTVQEGVLPSAVAPALPLMFIPNGRLLGALQSLISGVYKGPFAHLQTFFAVSHDSASGSFHLVDGRLALSWPDAGSEPAYARLDAALTDLVTRSGGSYVKNPLAGTVMGRQPATAHPLGGCGMGRERAYGVVNHMGQVFDAAPGRASNATHRGLYVVDGAVIPRSLGCNPLLTITALAERSLMHIAQSLGLSFSVDSWSGPVAGVLEPGALRA
ncbi:MAG: GMC family oxidoreductase N-terminal domain-containing protein [Hyphomicrobiaceae bacterium]